jgi:hypothetical protein
MNGKAEQSRLLYQKQITFIDIGLECVVLWQIFVMQLTNNFNILADEIFVLR